MSRPKPAAFYGQRPTRLTRRERRLAAEVARLKDDAREAQEERWRAHDEVRMWRSRTATAKEQARLEEVDTLRRLEARPGWTVSEAIERLKERLEAYEEDVPVAMPGRQFSARLPAEHRAKTRLQRDIATLRAEVAALEQRKADLEVPDAP